QGSGLMFLLQLALLYGSMHYLISSVKSYPYKIKYILSLFPLIPNIFAYSFMIWKDIGFAFCFLFVGSYLTCLSAKQNKPNIVVLNLLLIILLYGASIKFQAKYLAIILLFWIALIYTNFHIFCKKFMQIFSILMLSFYLLLNNINWLFIGDVKSNNSWQYVKLYDLSAISLAVNQDLLPDFNKNPSFTMQKMYSILHRKLLDRSSYYMVDTLIMGQNAILKLCNNQQQLDKLYATWLQTIIKHPYMYLKHRFFNLASMLFYHPAFKYVAPLLKENSLNYFIINGIIYLCFANFIPALLSVVYLIFGIYVYLNKTRNHLNKDNWFPIPLIFLNSVGIAMMLILFFASMAGTPRYTYITVCMTHASHIFAYLSFKLLKNRDGSHYLS
ncbi:MAG: hypothetical protein ACR2HS_05545, partial [Gammaproteobacteria bacterium]